MRILITGSSGFIGTHLMDRLVRSGHAVLGLDRNPPVEANLSKFSQQCDLLDRDCLVRSVTQFNPDNVLHLAARTDLNEKKNIQAYAANIEGVENLISAIERTPAVRRCIFTSSQMVCRTGYVPKNETDYCPHTLYGESKVCTEKIVRQHDGAGVEWCLVRPTSVWGPGMSEHYQRFLRMIQMGRYFHVTRRLLHKSYSYVGNIIFQYHKLLEASSPKIDRKVFYLADYEPLSLRHWANEIQRELHAPPIKTLPEGLARLAARTGDFANLIGFCNFSFNSFRLRNVLTEYVFDVRETEEVCGPLPYSMEEGVREMVKWFKHLQSKSVGK